MRRTLTRAISIAGIATFLATTAIAGTVKDTKARGRLLCGVATGLPGFAMRGQDKEWTGLDVDLCRAVAAAVLGDATKVDFIPLTAQERFPALKAGKVDLLARNTTWTQTRDIGLGINFAGVNYYDGQSFMVRRSSGIRRLSQLRDKSICVQGGTTHELNLSDYFSLKKLAYKPVVFDTSDQTIKGFENNLCDALTSDQSQLYALRTIAKNNKDLFILPQLISKEPLGPVVRQGDDQWLDLVQWTLFVMINAEEMKVSSQNVDQFKSTKNPQVLRLFGNQGKLGRILGIDQGWGYRIIKQVGNYGETFDRNVGMKSPLRIRRGLNALWSDGGIQYAPPVR